MAAISHFCLVVFDKCTANIFESFSLPFQNLFKFTYIFAGTVITYLIVWHLCALSRDLIKHASTSTRIWSWSIIFCQIPAVIVVIVKITFYPLNFLVKSWIKLIICFFFIIFIIVILSVLSYTLTLPIVQQCLIGIFTILFIFTIFSLWNRFSIYIF